MVLKPRCSCCDYIKEGSFRVRVYRKHIRQPHYQQLKCEEHFRSCEKGEFKIFPFFKLHLRETNITLVTSSEFLVEHDVI